VVLAKVAASPSPVGRLGLASPLGRAFKLIAKPIKTVPQSTLVGSSTLENATIPPQKYALAKNSKGRRTARKKPKLPIIAIIGSFPLHVYLNYF